jgi:hypothetical protein
VSNGNYFLVADREGHSLILLDSTGERYRATVDGRISGASVRSDGYLAIIQDQSESTGVVSIFAPDRATKLFDVILPNQVMSCQFLFPADGDSFDVTLVNTASSAARPVIKRYSLQGRQLGERRPDLAGIYPLAAYAGPEQLVLCGTASLAALTYANDHVLWQENYHQISAVRSAADGLLVLAADEQDGFSSLQLIKPDGQTKFNIKIGASVTNLDLRGNQACLSDGTHVLIISLADGSTLLDQDVSAEVSRVAFAKDGSLTVVTRSGVLRLSPPDQ